MNEPLAPDAQQGLIRLRGDVSYDGKEFSGWGLQPGRRTVQGVIEETLSTVLRQERVAIQCAGRTDAGVHARGQVIHFDLPIEAMLEMDDLLFKINSLLPEDVAIRKFQITSSDFDARFAALSRSYVYSIYQGERDPLLRDWAYRSWIPLDLAAMHEASQALLGLHDFAAFCRKREGSTTIRTLTRFDWHETDDGIFQADLSADAFCYSMVRALVGAVISIGEGKRDKEWLVSYLEGKTREPAVFAAPAHGLVFQSVEYPSESEFVERISQTLRMRPPHGTH